MTTEPTYTGAQIEEEAHELETAGFPETAYMLRSLLAERHAAMQGQCGEVPEGYDVGWKIRGVTSYSRAKARGFKHPECIEAAIKASQPPQPVRSVSDEDVMTACRKYYNCGHPVHPPVFEGMRAALEHFAAIAQGGE